MTTAATSTRKLFRYEVKVGTRYKGLLSQLTWVDFPWLDVPQLPKGSYRFHFTDLGREMLESEMPRLENKLEGADIRVVTTDEDRIQVCYEDPYQVAERRGSCRP